MKQRFQLTNGSRKYKLSKDLFSIKQNGLSLVEYFTSMSVIWEELDVMNMLPVINNVTPEITTFLNALEIQKQEARLFQFLNGLDDIYASQRSQILMMNPLLVVEMACSVIQQEKSQRETLKLNMNSGYELTAIYNKTNQSSVSKNVCSKCGRKGHSRDDCWSIVGYPKWHNKHKRIVQTKSNSTSSSGQWQHNKGNKMVNVAQSCDANDSQVLITAKQLEQLIRMLPGKTQSEIKGSIDELESPFSGMIAYNAQYRLIKMDVLWTRVLLII